MHVEDAAMTTDAKFTRCPGCSTVFRVTFAQLALREGQVRCGHCRAVFDANDHFVSLDATPADEFDTTDELIMGRPTVTLRNADALQPIESKNTIDVPQARVASPAAETTSADRSSKTGDDADAAIHMARDDDAFETARDELTHEAREDVGPGESNVDAGGKAGDVDRGIDVEGASADFARPNADAETPVDQDNAAVDADRAGVDASIAERANADVETPVASSTESEAAVDMPHSRSTNTDDAVEQLKSSIAEATSAEAESASEPARPTSEPEAPSVVDEEPPPDRDEAARADVGPIDLARPVSSTRFEWKKRSEGSARRLLMVAAVALALGIVLQTVLHFRDSLAAHAPVMRPLLETACSAIGCTIDPLRDASALSIDASDLQADPAHRGLLLLSATIRNRSPHAIAYPLLELTLTDSSDQVVARRAFTPAEYASGTADPRVGIPANGERVVRMFLDASATQQAGYRLYLFYP